MLSTLVEDAFWPPYLGERGGLLHRNTKCLHTPGEGAVDGVLGVSRGTLADGRVAEAEARGAAKLIVPLQVEEARAAAVALAPLHVGLATADARRSVARRRTVHAAGHAAATRPASQ